MNTIKDEDQVIYYHSGKQDLLEHVEFFETLKIGLGYFDESPVRICPRPDNSNKYEFIWHILLFNTGNKENDRTTLNEALSKFKREFRGEL